MAQFEFIEWLALWLLETSIFHFDWDEGNSSKSQIKHGVLNVEVEEVFVSGLLAPLGVQFSPVVEEERLAVIGSTIQGKILTIVFTLRDGKIRPISSRVANRKEREIYENVCKIS